jgi:hypothetical protein
MSLSPVFNSNIKIEGLGGVGEDLVGKCVCNLLGQDLRSDVRRPTDRGIGDWLAKRQTRGFGSEIFESRGFVGCIPSALKRFAAGRFLIDHE